MTLTAYRTRIKLCGLTCFDDVKAAVSLGADAIGFVFYPQSPRYVSPESVGSWLAGIPPFVTTTGLFVNPTCEEVIATLAKAPISLLQFHGDETPEDCAAIASAVQRPFIRAVRMKRETTCEDVLKYERDYRAASPFFCGLLLDTWIETYGGSGQTFNWSLIPQQLRSQLVLSGGLNASNIVEAIRGVRPYGVDVSSGIEITKGIKDIKKMQAFVEAVYSTIQFS